MRSLRPALVVMIAAAALLLGGKPAAAQTEVITLRTGNGTVFGTDSKITYTTSVSPLNFAAARTGAAAVIQSPFVGSGDNFWHPLTSDPLAQYIGRAHSGVNGGGPAGDVLFAYKFTVTAATINTATLNLAFLVDNQLGTTATPGLYINEQAVPGTNGIGDYFTETQVSANIASMLQTGENTLYFYQRDLGGVAGSVFSARIGINEESSAVPEPGSLMLFLPALGLIGVVRRSRRQG